MKDKQERGVEIRVHTVRINRIENQEFYTWLKSWDDNKHESMDGFCEKWMNRLNQNKKEIRVSRFRLIRDENDDFYIWIDRIWDKEHKSGVHFHGGLIIWPELD